MKISWDEVGKHFYETGVSKGVLYPMNDANQGYDKGVAWNGLTAVTESPDGAEVTPVYADNIKYLNLMSAEDFKATIEAYTYPDEFEPCDGSAELGEGVKIGQQDRKSFGFCYQTKIGNDQTSELGYKIHIIYGALAAPAERAYETVNDSPEAMTFSWEISTIPVDVPGFKPTAHVEIDSTKCDPTALAAIEAALYGTDNDDPRLLMPEEIMEILNGGAKFNAPELVALYDQQLLAINDSQSGVTSFDVYEGDELVGNVVKTANTTVVAYGQYGLGLDEGSHVLKAKAKGSELEDSDFSDPVQVVVSSLQGVGGQLPG